MYKKVSIAIINRSSIAIFLVKYECQIFSNQLMDLKSSQKLNSAAIINNIVISI